MNLLKSFCAVLLCSTGFVAATANAQNIAGTYTGTYAGAESGTVTITIAADNRTVKCDFSGHIFYGSAFVISSTTTTLLSIECSGGTITDAWGASGSNAASATSIKGGWSHTTASGFGQGTFAVTLSSGGSGGFTIGPGITGSWFDPQQSGHGFSVEVLPTNPPQLLAYWYAFAPTGDTTWILGVGPINGNQAVLAAAQEAGPGGLFPPNFNPAQVSGVPWGTMTLTFSDCTHGHVHWSSTVAGYGSGDLDIQRLTMPAGLSCP